MKRIPQHYLGAVLMLVGIGAMAWSCVSWSQAKSSSQAAAADLIACESLEREITLLRDQPKQAQAVALESPDMARRIEQVAQQAGIDKRNIERIAPTEPHRIKDSVFLESSTQITLGHVTLPQLVRFLHALSVGSAGERDLRIQAVRMGAPRGGEAGNTWGAEITLSYLVYSPKTESNSVP